MLQPSERTPLFIGIEHHASEHAIPHWPLHKVLYALAPGLKHVGSRIFSRPRGFFFSFLTRQDCIELSQASLKNPKIVHWRYWPYGGLGAAR